MRICIYANMRICDAVYPDPVSVVRPSDAALLPAGQCGSYIVPGDPSSFSRSEPVQDPAQGRGVRTASPAGTRRERERGAGGEGGGGERESSCENVERPAPLSSYECCVLCVCVYVCMCTITVYTDTLYYVASFSIFVSHIIPSLTPSCRSSSASVATTTFLTLSPWCSPSPSLTMVKG